jgi:methyl-accepting chemotaxis protein
MRRHRTGVLRSMKREQNIRNLSDQIDRQLEPLREALGAVEELLEDLHAAQQRAETLLNASAVLRQSASEHAETLQRVLGTSIVVFDSAVVLRQ